MQAGAPLYETQQELTPCEQGGRRESSFLPRFFRIFSVKRDFEKRIFQNLSVRASVRPVSRANRDTICRFCLTKNEGIQEETNSLFVTLLAFK